ncbi:MAG TPA: winged helix-turn-helix transcriptional regulator [Candidatus Coprenecus stercoravium]|uniref:Winged helix-turn-helix transcriptional regulator n=1 Tax=Candidatus Coprenecus stercoravium TaxID=2840735 RepID=A0A9D2K9X3_9BACT|nr:winged helix-turn-helix transcriptional regulator [Candidatus Coprenecus stercoravium]
MAYEGTVLATFPQEKVPMTRGKSREKIIALLSEDGALTMAALARRIGITPKAVEKQIARLKADGILERIGPDKGGRWHIVK